MLYYVDTLWSYWNNLLIQNYLELGKIRVSKVHRKIRSPVNRSRIRPQILTLISSTIVKRILVYQRANKVRRRRFVCHAHSTTIIYTLFTTAPPEPIETYKVVRCHSSKSPINYKKDKKKPNHLLYLQKLM